MWIQLNDSYSACTGIQIKTLPPVKREKEGGRRYAGLIQTTLIYTTTWIPIGLGYLDTQYLTIMPTTLIDTYVPNFLSRHITKFFKQIRIQACKNVRLCHDLNLEWCSPPHRLKAWYQLVALLEVVENQEVGLLQGSSPSL